MISFCFIHWEVIGEVLCVGFHFTTGHTNHLMFSLNCTVVYDYNLHLSIPNLIKHMLVLFSGIASASKLCSVRAFHGIVLMLKSNKVARFSVVQPSVCCVCRRLLRLSHLRSFFSVNELHSVYYRRSETSAEYRRTKLCSFALVFLIWKDLLVLEKKPSTIFQTPLKTSTQHPFRENKQANLTSR